MSGLLLLVGLAESSVKSTPMPSFDHRTLILPRTYLRPGRSLEGCSILPRNLPSPVSMSWPQQGVSSAAGNRDDTLAAMLLSFAPVANSLAMGLARCEYERGGALTHLKAGYDRK